MVRLKVGDFSEEIIKFPNGYYLKFLYGELDDSGQLNPNGTKLTSNYRLETLYDSDDNIIAQKVAKRYMLDEDLFEKLPYKDE